MSGKWTSASLAYVQPRASGQTDAWTEESAGQRGSQELVEVAEVEPPQNVAEMLRLTDGERAVVRRRVMRVDGQPIELTDSYYPPAIARGTALAEHRKIRGGAPTLLAELGYRAGHVVEDVESRMPTEQERSALDLTSGEPVLVLSRLTLSHRDEPMEASLMVMRARGRRLRYETEVD